MRVVKDIFSVIIFPIGLYRLIHSLAGKLIVPASAYPSTYADDSRKAVDLSGEWKIKRLSIKVDGYTIDAAIMCKASSVEKRRWVLASNGNGEVYEDKLGDYSFRQILSRLNGNALVFNYPGVGSSTGMPSRKAMAKAYRAMLHFLEDKENGMGAEEIIGYGHSIGGGVQGDALRSHELRADVKYVFVKSRTFSDLSTTVSCILNRFLGFLVKVFGWNMSSVESSKALTAPEIIIQTYAGAIAIDDGVIPAEASLAKKLLDDAKQEPFIGKKCFIGISETHNQSLEPASENLLVKKIKEMLAAQQRGEAPA